MFSDKFKLWVNRPIEITNGDILFIHTMILLTNLVVWIGNA